MIFSRLNGLKLVSIFTVLFSFKAFSVQEFETVVREVKFNSSSRVVIDREEIQKSKARNLTTLLATQANISIAQSNFTPYSIYLRGGDSSHVLIMVDGVPYYDASTIQRTINLNALDVKSVQRIEVIKGSQSVLYGGQALSGVIKIETIPQDLKNQGDIILQGGSFNQKGVSVGYFEAKDNVAGVMVRGSYNEKDNVSPVLDSKKIYPTQVGTGELGFIVKGDVQYLFKAQTSFDKTLISTTAFPSYRAADADNFETSTYQLNVTNLISFKNLAWKPQVSLTGQKSARLFEQDFTSSNGSPTKQDYVGELLNLRLELAPVETEKNNFIFGGQFAQEKIVYQEFDVLRADETDQFEGFFAKGRNIIDPNFEVEYGYRLDFSRLKEKIDTFQLGLTLVKDLRAEYSTGFKQPSLFQLYSSYGNPDLEPEKSKSFSVSLDHKFDEKLFASFTTFVNQFENLIIIRGSPQKYENVQSSDTRGYELATVYRQFEQGLTYNLALGYQEPYDNSQKTWLVRRPLRTASLKIRKEFNDKARSTIEVIHNGDRRDRAGATSYGTLSAYTLVHLVGEYEASEQISVFARIQNLADHHYESSYGFYDEGRSVTAGLEYSF